MEIANGVTMDTNVLATIDPHLLGERLADARRARGLTQIQAATELGVARTTLTAMEKGGRRPRPTELVALARLYGRTVGSLVAPPPPGPGFVVQFRAAHGAAADTAPRIEDVERFEQWSLWYADLEAMTNSPLPRRYPEPYDVSATPPAAAGEEVAAAERNRLGLGDGPLGDLWTLLESDVGLRIFAMAMRDRPVAGMFFFDAVLGGCIAVNANHPEPRRRWTLAHEYAHFLTDRQRAEVTVSRFSRNHRPDDRERFADAFAGAFLMPAAGLAARFRAIVRAKAVAGFTPADLLGLCHLYGTSFGATTRRLEGLRLLPAGTYDTLAEQGFKPDEARALVDLPDERVEARRFPTRYERLAATAFRAGRLSEGRLARMLDTDRVAAVLRVEEIAGQEIADHDDDARQLRLDLGAKLELVGTR
jgi:Zn-dependent peptidase ImmA (M78 family)/DNA-binding XRE family transcriptional regulator